MIPPRSHKRTFRPLNDTDRKFLRPTGMNNDIENNGSFAYLMSLLMEGGRPSGSAAEPGIILRTNGILLRIGSTQHTEYSGTNYSTPEQELSYKL